MKGDSMASIRRYAIQGLLGNLVLLSPIAGVAEAPQGMPSTPASLCDGVTSDPTPACNQPRLPVSPSSAPEEPPSSAESGKRQPAESNLCACLRIEEIDEFDAIVLRRGGVQVDA
jgi:hypothetical protein